MAGARNSFLKLVWQVVDRVVDIVGKLGVPIVLGYLTYTLSTAQHELAVEQAERQKQEMEANRDLKLLDIFYREVISKDPTRRQLAFSIVEVYAGPTLLKALATVAPEVALKSSVGISENQSQPEQTRAEAERIRYSIANRFVISQPSDGDNVDIVIEIKGDTPFSEILRHYIIVTPLKTGTDIVEAQATVSQGSFSGRAKLGSAGVGGGDEFAIRILATKSKLTQGLPPPILEDAINSNSITVTRKN